MGELILPLEALVAAVLLVLLVLGTFVLRRHLLTRSGGTFDCSVRQDLTGRGNGWSLGVARYESDRLDWFRIFTMDPRPRSSWARHRLVILDRRPPEGPEAYAVLPNAVIVRCAYGGSTLELAMTAPNYDGFATWLESAPPRAHGNVT